MEVLLVSAALHEISETVDGGRGGGVGFGGEVVVMNFQVCFQREKGIINHPVALMQSTIPQRYVISFLFERQRLIWNFL